MLDHIGGNLISIRRSTSGVAITRLTSGAPPMDLSGEEWLELATLVHAITAAADFSENHEVVKSA